MNTKNFSEIISFMTELSRKTMASRKFTVYSLRKDGIFYCGVCNERFEEQLAPAFKKFSIVAIDRYSYDVSHLEDAVECCHRFVNTQLFDGEHRIVFVLPRTIKKYWIV